MAAANALEHSGRRLLRARRFSKCPRTWCPAPLRHADGGGEGTAPRSGAALTQRVPAALKACCVACPSRHRGAAVVTPRAYAHVVQVRHARRRHVLRRRTRVQFPRWYVAHDGIPGNCAEHPNSFRFALQRQVLSDGSSCSTKGRRSNAHCSSEVLPSSATNPHSLAVRGRVAGCASDCECALLLLLLCAALALSLPPPAAVASITAPAASKCREQSRARAPPHHRPHPARPVWHRRCPCRRLSLSHPRDLARHVRVICPPAQAP